MAENLSIKDNIALFESTLRTEEQLKIALSDFEKDELVNYILGEVISDDFNDYGVSEDDDDDEEEDSSDSRKLY